MNPSAACGAGKAAEAPPVAEEARRACDGGRRADREGCESHPPEGPVRIPPSPRKSPVSVFLCDLKRASLPSG